MGQQAVNSMGGKKPEFFGGGEKTDGSQYGLRNTNSISERGFCSREKGGAGG